MAPPRREAEGITVAGMDRRATPPPTVPTAAWLAEQRAKQERYAAARRRWRERLERHAMPEREPAEREPERGPAAADESAGAAGPARGGPQRPRGVVHDPRQARFDLQRRPAAGGVSPPRSRMLKEVIMRGALPRRRRPG